MAAELEVPLETYVRWEETGDDVPISAIYHMAHHFGVEFTEILTGTAAKLDTYQVVRWGEEREVDRYRDTTSRILRGATPARSCSRCSWCSILPTSPRSS
ncbi:MAG: hypothetical protein ACLSGS_06475 [Adlercreutzia sp.]